MEGEKPQYLEHQHRQLLPVNVDDTNMPTQPSMQTKRTTMRQQRRLIDRFRTDVSDDAIGPIPDGGLLAWAQVLGAHFTVCNSWGYVSAFGVFQSTYEEMLTRSASDISWIGSTQIFMLFLVGTVSGRAADAGFFKLTWTMGAVLTLVGILASSFSTAYWQLFIGQGICMGLGAGLMFCPVLSLLPTYFSKHRCLAVGLAATGSATGGLMFPAVVGHLLPKIGFPWTMRVLGLLTLVMLLPSWLLLRSRVPPRKTGPLVEWAAFKEPSYTLFAIGMFLNFWGIYVAFFYTNTFGMQIVGLSREQATNLLMVLNGVGVFFRILPNYAADRWTGPLNLLIPSTLVSGVMLLVWIAVSDRVGLYIFAVLYGIFAASAQSLFPATLASISPDVKKLGTRLGMVLTIISFASLTGPPIAGALLARAGGSYLYVQLFAGLNMVVGTGTIIAARVARVGLALRAKA